MTVCMTIGRGVPQHVNAYLRDWIAREWTGKGHTQKELADELGVTKTTISDFAASKRGAGYELFTGIARKIGRSREDVEREALAWWRAQGGDVGQPKKDPYPNRTAALEFLRVMCPPRLRAASAPSRSTPQAIPRGRGGSRGSCPSSTSTAPKSPSLQATRRKVS